MCFCFSAITLYVENNPIFEATFLVILANEEHSSKRVLDK